MPDTPFKPLTLYDAMASPDILDAVRTFLFLPTLPSIGAPGRSDWLAIRCVQCDLPPIRVGQVRVPLPGGHIRAFRGERDHGNTFSAAFLESALGDTLYSFMAWQELCSSSKDGSSTVSDLYGVELFRVVFDTIGKTATAHKLINCWPQQVTPPASAESSGPARVEVTFSVDWIDLVAGGPMETGSMLGFLGLPSPADLGGAGVNQQGQGLSNSGLRRTTGPAIQGMNA